MPDEPHASFELSPADLATRMGRVQLVDLRTRGAATIEGARHIQLAELRHEVMTLDRERPLVLIGSGSEAAEAVAALRELGFTAYALGGDTDAWREAGLRIDARGDR